MSLGQIARGDVVPFGATREVQHSAHAFQRGVEALAGHHVAFDMFDAGLGRVRMTTEDPDVDPRGMENRDDPAAYRASTSGYEDGCIHGSAPFRCHIEALRLVSMMTIDAMGM